MEISVDRVKLTRAIRVASSATASMHRQEILKHLRLRVVVADENLAIELAGTDGEVYAESKIPVGPGLSADANFEAAVPARQFGEYVDQMTGQTVVFSTVEGKRVLEVRSGRMRLNLPMMDTAGFPEPPDLQEPVILELHRLPLTVAIERTMHARSPEAKGRTATQCLLFSPDLEERGGSLVITATDDRRMARTVCPVGAQDEAQDLSRAEDVLLHHGSITSILRALNENEDRACRMELTHACGCLTAGDHRITFPIVDGAFPPVSGIVDRCFGISVVTDLATEKSALLAAVRRGQNMAKFTAAEDDTVILYGEERGCLTVLAGLPTSGKRYEEEIDATIGGETVLEGFGARYLTEAVEQAPGEKVRLRLVHNNRAKIAIVTGDEQAGEYVGLVVTRVAEENPVIQAFAEDIRAGRESLARVFGEKPAPAAAKAPEAEEALV